MAGARQIVDGPTFTPSRLGLLDVVQFPTPAGPHWQNGITWASTCVTGGTTYDECITVTGTGSPPAPAAFADNVDWNNRGATPFTIYTEFDCSPVGFFEDAQKLAEEMLAKSESWQVEQAVWTGTAGGTANAVWPHLAAFTAAVDSQSITLQSPAVTGGLLKPSRALGAVEAILADCYHGQGVIHIPLDILNTFIQNGMMFRQSDGSYLTPSGNLVVAGSGYPGTSPQGAAPAANTMWIYATGAIFAYRSAVRIHSPRESLDRAENTVKMIAQRTYVLGWDCCHAGVLVDLA